MFEITATTEGEIDHKTATETPMPNHALRDEFETIWRIAGLPLSDLIRNPDGTYKATHAMHAWGMYAKTREWRAVLWRQSGRVSR